MTGKLDQAMEPDAQAEAQESVRQNIRPKWTKPELKELKIWSETEGVDSFVTGDEPFSRTLIS